MDTGLAERELQGFMASSEPTPEIIAVAALAALGAFRPPRDADPWSTLAGWRHWTQARQFALLEWHGRHFDVQVTGRSRGTYDVHGADAPLSVEIIEADGPELRLRFGDRIASALAVEHDTRLTVQMDGRAFEFGLPDRLAEDEDVDAADDRLLAPMPGRVTLVSTKIAARVAKGEPLIVMEAMKMEHTLVAPRDGIVATLLVKPGDQVANGSVLLTLETPGA